MVQTFVIAFLASLLVFLANKNPMVGSYIEKLREFDNKNSNNPSLFSLFFLIVYMAVLFFTSVF